MRMIAIIDYDAGNIKSVEKALKYLGEDAVITRDRRRDTSADKVIRSGSRRIWRCHVQSEKL